MVDIHRFDCKKKLNLAEKIFYWIFEIRYWQYFLKGRIVLHWICSWYHPQAYARLSMEVTIASVSSQMFLFCFAVEVFT